MMGILCLQKNTLKSNIMEILPAFLKFLYTDSNRYGKAKGTLWDLFIVNVTKTNDIYTDNFLLLTVPFQTHETSNSGLLEHCISYS
jgi:hypothetical protein